MFLWWQVTSCWASASLSRQFIISLLQLSVCVHIQSYYTQQKHLSRVKEKGCWRGLIGPNLPYVRGGLGGFIISSRLQGCREGCFRRKTPELTFRAWTRSSPLGGGTQKKAGGGEEEAAAGGWKLAGYRAESQVRGRKFERPQRCTSIISSLSWIIRRFIARFGLS